MKVFLSIFILALLCTLQLSAQNADFNTNPTFVGTPEVLSDDPEAIVATWAAMASSPNALSRSCAAYIQMGATGYIYQFGGGSGAQFTSVARYNVSTNTWETAGFAPIPSAMSSASAVAIGDSNIYLFGGESVAGLGRTFSYNVYTNSWTTLANMPTLVTDAGVVKYGQKVFVIGGGTGLFGTGYFNTVQVYDIATNSYSSGGTYPIAAGMMGVGIYKDTIIAAGGWDGVAATSNAYKGVINPATSQVTWTPLPAYPAGTITRMASHFVWKNTGGGVLFSGGAIGGSTVTGLSYLWDMCNNAWATLPPLSLARSNMKAASRGDSVAYVVAGYNGAAGVGNTDRITFSQIDGSCIMFAPPGPLNAFNLLTPTAGTKITTLPGSTTPVTVTWDTASSTASYKWIFGAPTVPPRLLTLPSATNSMNTTLGALDAILAGLGLNPGDSVIGQWDVWAFRNNPPANDSLKSTNGPRAITLKRGVPSLTAFNLLSPANNSTIITSVNNPASTSFMWSRSGAGNTYRWKFGAPTIGTVVFNQPSNSSGFDTTFTVPIATLDGWLAGRGLNPGDSINGQWSAWAYSGSDSLKATQTWNVTLKRQGLGEVLVVYDSTSVACRASRDSVTAILAARSITFDLKNRGTVTSTLNFSMRGYKKVIWLGEATSTIAAGQRDSIKAYLNAGGTTTATKSKLAIFAEDVGYQHGRTGSTYLDLDLVNNYFGWNYVADRAGGTGNHGLIGMEINTGLADSTVGSWPDVFQPYGVGTNNLYRLRNHAPDSLNGIGKVAANWIVATFGVDIESIRRAVDSPPGGPVERMLVAALNYLDQTAATPSVTVTSPNGGESWVVGQTYPITWIQTLVDTVKIEYTTNGGTGWTVISTGVPALAASDAGPEHSAKSGENVENIGSYSWLIPNTPSTNCLVRVSHKSNPATFDVSNGPFTITSTPPVQPIIVYVDSLNGLNDTTALHARGYKTYYRGTGPQGTTATWFQGNPTVFPSYNGPSDGYVAANYNVVTGTNNIDSWLVLPALNIQTGDSLKFFERSPAGSTWPDSMRVMYSAAGDSVPEAGSWVELGRFQNDITGFWQLRWFRAMTSGTNGRFALRYAVVNGGPSGTNSNFIGVDMIMVIRPAPVSVGGGANELPKEFALDQNYPNPFNPTTTLQFALPEQSTISLKIYNMLGQEVVTLASGSREAGYFNAVWDGRNAAGAMSASGVYFYRFDATGASGKTFSSLKKMVFLK